MPAVQFEKLEKDGKVAVLISPGYGYAWYTRNSHYGRAFLFDKDLIQPVLDGDKMKAIKTARKKYPECHVNNNVELEVRWLAKGTLFNVVAYDGCESIHLFTEDLYIAA